MRKAAYRGEWGVLEFRELHMGVLRVRAVCWGCVGVSAAFSGVMYFRFGDRSTSWSFAAVALQLFQLTVC
jgi:hypothetical protein